MADPFTQVTLTGFFVTDLQALYTHLDDDEVTPEEVAHARGELVTFCYHVDEALRHLDIPCVCDEGYEGVLAWALIMLQDPDGVQTEEWHISVSRGVVTVSSLDLMCEDLTGTKLPSEN